MEEGMNRTFKAICWIGIAMLLIALLICGANS